MRIDYRIIINAEDTSIVASANNQPQPWATSAIVVYAATEAAADLDKDQFYEKLNSYKLSVHMFSSYSAIAKQSRNTTAKAPRMHVDQTYMALVVLTTTPVDCLVSAP